MKAKEWFLDKFLKLKSDKGFIKNLTKKKIVLIIIAIILVLLLCVLVFGKGKNKADEKQSYVETQVQVGNVVETIEQSGVVEPLDRYEITSLVKGEIIASPFNEGDEVKEGDTLYQIDDEDAQLAMEKAQMSLEEANENVAKLNIYAPSTGRLSGFSLEIGDSVGNGLIGEIVNTNRLTVDIPFSASDFEKISVGDKVTITSALYMTSLPGRVSHKYYANVSNEGSGSVLKNIEIEIDNPGALAENTSFAATVHTGHGDVNSSGSGIIDSGKVTELRAETSGTVTYVAVKDGDFVEKGQLIAKLKNNSLVNSQKTSSLNVKSNQKTLDNYNIKAPISGTIITKNSKAGDKIDNSNSQTVMMVVADMSKMKFTISVDELDIADINLGQKAIVDADALPDDRFDATVTNIASEGVSSGDGVTTYDVELTIDKPGDLRPGMNVNANILINEAYGVLTIPEDALMSVRGTTANVLVKTDKKSEKEKKTEKKEGTPENSSQSPRNTREANVNLPAGYEMRQVEIGVSDGTNIEILSGLSEGDTIAYIPSSANTENGFMRMMSGMMGGGMPPGGGMSPSGNRSGGGGMPGGR